MGERLAFNQMVGGSNPSRPVFCVATGHLVEDLSETTSVVQTPLGPFLRGRG
jgi:hypothetical protein